MATLTTITSGMEKGPDAINANDVALNKDINTLVADQSLTWIDLPLASGIKGGLYIATAFNDGVVFIKGQVTGTFPNATMISSCAGTPLANLHWVDTPVVTSSGTASLQTNASGVLYVQGVSGTVTQINPAGVFLK